METPTDTAPPSTHAPAGAALRAAPAIAQQQTQRQPQVDHTERWPVVCRICGGPATRVALRPAARWLSRLVPVRRFHCDSRRCGWQGNVFG